MSDTINWNLTLLKLRDLPASDVRRLANEASRELVRRRVERYAAQLTMRGMSNFMAGVTWALACRASLRASKEHPPIGRGLASGEMWMPWEMVYAVRHEVKERGWSPIAAKDARDVVQKLSIEANRKDTSKAPAAVTFNIKFAGGTAQTFRSPSQRWADAMELVDKAGL